ncbi:MAG: prenyltransferase [Acidimicrobiales bacterium]
MTNRLVRIEIPEVVGVLSASDVLASAGTIAAVQRPDGMIPWFDGGHCDPWNHVEAAMALSVCGLDAEADAAFDWLAERQLADGSWFNYYLDQGIKDPRLDTNVCAYVATGVLHRFLVTGAVDHLSRHWSMVETAIDFVLRWQRPDGSVLWAVDPSGRCESYALLTGSSSIYHALRCAVAIAEALGKERPEWELAAGRLGHAVAHHAGSFAPKDEYAMDWYYPVLSGALPEAAAHHRIVSAWDRYVIKGRGVRCVSSQEWVTAAETAECVIALDALGLDRAARELFTSAQGLRLPDGSYWTGMVYPQDMTFPAAERTTYTAAAVILAADALCGATPASGLFRGEGLPAPLDLPESSCTWDTDDCTARRRL